MVGTSGPRQCSDAHPKMAEQAREDAAVLSYAMCMENYLYPALGGSAPAKTARTEREFRMDLQFVEFTVGPKWTGNLTRRAHPHCLGLRVGHADPRYSRSVGQGREFWTPAPPAARLLWVSHSGLRLVRAIFKY